ncbi:serine/threonine-protein kinase ULK3 [Nilaparvata lugens]|uniref:serine/threonine-protein kinase ULK3 n=1 Tax=Nilaparvata lugens TaxID=108931 RepID=UPI00193E4BE1|nr:serine/threonine-protein kinase ULK3 [Nilaparvata lugens]
MAPEMVSGRPSDAKVDLWSVGVIFYECLYGRPPFADCSFDQLTKLFSDNDVVVKIPSDGDVSTKSRHLLSCLLQTDPAQRIEFDVFFAHPLIEVAHAPSKHTYRFGVHLADKAVRLDYQRRLAEAVDFYVDAIPTCYRMSNLKRTS